MAVHLVPHRCNAAGFRRALLPHASSPEYSEEGRHCSLLSASYPFELTSARRIVRLQLASRGGLLGARKRLVLDVRSKGAEERVRALDTSWELEGRLSAVKNAILKRSAAELRTSTIPGASKVSEEVHGLEKKFTRKIEFKQRSVGKGAKVLVDSDPLVPRSNSRQSSRTKRSREVVRQVDDPSKIYDDGLDMNSSSDLDCKFFSRCSGCTFEHALDRPPVLKDAIKLFKDYGIKDFSFTSGNLWEWRCRAKLAVRGTSENPMIGLYEEGSHTVVDIPSCRAHHPRINTAVQYVKEAIREFGIEPYNEESESGCLRYIQMVISTYNTSIPASERYANGRVQVTLVWNTRDENSPQAKFLQPMAEFLWKKGGAKSSTPILHSIWANFQTSRSNTIFGGKWRHLLGDRELWERIAGADICFSPGSFGQANIQAFDELLRKLQTYVKKGSVVVELYAGVGAIGISLAATRACRSMKCVEVNKESRIPFQTSLSRLPDTVDCEISWHCADASVSTIRWLDGSDVVIVDPPRKGLEPSVIEALRTASFRGKGELKSASLTTKVEKRPWLVRASQGVMRSSSSGGQKEKESFWPSTLIYVSCGWQSFKQDCSALVKDNAWQLDDGHAFNFFPGTNSIEVLAVFKRGQKLKGRKKGLVKAK